MSRAFLDRMLANRQAGFSVLQFRLRNEPEEEEEEEEEDEPDDKEDDGDDDDDDQDGYSE